jgi:hypothetical protein
LIEDRRQGEEEEVDYFNSGLATKTILRGENL